MSESQPKKERDTTPWQVCQSKASEDGTAAITVVAGERHGSLKAAEKAAQSLAAKDIGTIYAPVKFGALFKAEKKESVEVKRS